MFCLDIPRVRFLSKTNLDGAYQHSILIHILRGLAAVEVAAAHLRAQFFPGLRGLSDPSLWYQVLAFFTGFAHLAVVVFFVLSGWLVGGSLLNKLREPNCFLSYSIDRLTRMWIVLIPAFVLTLALAAFTGQVDLGRASYSAENEYSVATFIGNLFGLQDMVVPRYGGNFALWSLANELWYYLLFPLLVVPFVAKNRLASVAAVLIFAFIAYHLSVRIVLYFLIWLLGVGFSRIRIDAGRSFRLLLLAVLATVSVYIRLTGSNDILEPESFVQDLVFSLVFLAYLSTQQFKAGEKRLATRVARVVGERLAAFSFTLYVIHVPLLFTLRQILEPLGRARLSPHALADLGIYAAMLMTILLLAYLFHLPFEAQTYRVRAAIKQAMLAFGTRRPDIVA